ncbi:MAG: class 1 fructose-bisphosphatase [Candidatus Competibacteraceae bacterium]|nr:class 1 fructose-bisphosphatase [Candidatus Competibacteraceae bacterium]
MTTQLTLRQYLLQQQAQTPGSDNFAALMEDISQAVRKISYLISRGELGGALGSADTDNVQGEVQKKLDIISNEIMLESLEWSGHWAAIASEEMADALPIPAGFERGRYLCLFDPLDGSSNTDINGSVGTIFSILPAPEGVTEIGNEHFLQPGTQQLAAGFALYGPATLLVLTIGQGVHAFTLDRGSGEFILTHSHMQVPPDTREFVINMANRRYWTEPMRRYVDECMQGTDSPRGVHFNMRWVGSMVADAYRLLCQGGIFMYPWDNKDPGKPGKLRLLYEVNPMGLLIEQAGGAASTGTQRVLELQPDSLHQRAPVILGSKNEVERVVAYHVMD